MSPNERIFLDSSIIIGLFTGDDAAEFFGFSPQAATE